MTTYANHSLFHTVLLWTLLCTAGCRSAPYVWVQHLPRETERSSARTIVGPGDLVQVQVFDDEKMSTVGRVLPDGTLSMPVLGPVLVTGKTSEELARSLEGHLTRYMQAPKVTVTIQESLISVAVIGEVKEAGVVNVVTPAPVLKALAAAGGLTEFADSSGIYVLRTERGKTQRIRFSYSALSDGEPAATRFHLKTGDVLIVE